MADRHDDASSLTDLMAGLAAIFLLIAVVFILLSNTREQLAAVREHESTDMKARCQEKIDELKGIKDNIQNTISALRTAFESNPRLMEFASIDEDALRRDPFVFPLLFRQNRLSFASSECTLSAERAGPFLEVAPLLVNSVCAAAESLQKQAGKDGKLNITIALEGHTDQEPYLPGNVGCGVDHIACIRTPDPPACRQLGFENNVRLSGARAQSVFFAMQRAVANDSALSTCLEKYFVVSGRGPVEPIDGRNWQEPRSPLEDELNRRVVLKIRPQATMEGLVAEDMRPGP